MAWVRETNCDNTGKTNNVFKIKDYYICHVVKKVYMNLHFLLIVQFLDYQHLFPYT